MKMRMMSTFGMAGMVTGNKQSTMVYEPTYKTDPDDNRKFSQAKAEQIIFRYYIPIFSPNKSDIGFFFSYRYVTDIIM